MKDTIIKTTGILMKSYNTTFIYILLLFTIAFMIACQPEVDIQEEKAKMVEKIDKRMERVEKEKENIRKKYGPLADPDNPEAERILVSYLSDLEEFKRSLMVMRRILMDENETDIPLLKRNTRGLILRIDKEMAETRQELKGIPVKDQKAEEDLVE